jgi:hypothetical protein
VAVSGFFWLVHMAVSSANSPVFVRGSSETGKSLEERRGERMEPWGTPAWSCIGTDLEFWILTLQVRLVR